MKYVLSKGIYTVHINLKL